MTDRSAPVWIVEVLKADGSVDDSIDLSQRVLSIEYQDTEKKTDLLKLSLDNSDLAIFDTPVFVKGTRLRACWGYAGWMGTPRDVVVQKCSGSLKLTIEAEDKGCLLHKKSKVRTFENQKRSDVARTIAKEFGYTDPTKVIIDDTEIVYETIIQAAQTDAQFLKKLADLEGFEFYIDFDGFHWHRRRMEQRPTRKLTYFLPPNVGDITSFDIKNDPTQKPSSVTVAGRDGVTGKNIKETADANTVARNTVATNAEMPPPAPAVQPIQKIDPRTGETSTVYPAPPANPPPGGDATTQTKPTTAKSSAEAKREAAALFTRTQQTGIEVTFNIIGDPSFVGKAVVEVDGIGTRLSGRYFVTEVTHKLVPSGYTISFVGKSEGTNNKTGGMGKAKPNKKEAPEDKGPAPQPMTPVLKVDPRTGETSTVYVNSQGRDLASQKNNG